MALTGSFFSCEVCGLRKHLLELMVKVGNLFLVEFINYHLLLLFNRLHVDRRNVSLFIHLLNSCAGLQSRALRVVLLAILIIVTVFIVLLCGVFLVAVVANYCDYRADSLSRVLLSFCK
jgi:hypothetical protein